jgi:hypothetical protein
MTAGIPLATFETGLQFVKKFWVVQEAKEDFWDSGVARAISIPS